MLDEIEVTDTSLPFEETEDIFDISLPLDSNTGSANTASDNSELNAPLYPGAKISLHIYSLCHKISNEALDDLLSLLREILNPPTVLPTTLYMFFKILNIKQTDTLRCYYCPSCQHPIDNPKTTKCPNSTCSKTFQTSSDLAYFVQLPLEKHVQTIYSRPGFLEQIKHRFIRKKEKTDAIEDIYDGFVYKKLAERGGILSSPVNISLLWNTDGVPVFKSSNFSIWPLFFVINELPYTLRMKMKNSILAGLWFGSGKPNMQVFLRPFSNVLRKMETEGVAWHVERSFTAKVVLIAGTCDLPAKSLVQNFKQFNGFYGCGKCLQPGSTHVLGPNRRTHVYLYQAQNPCGPPRTKEQTSNDLQWVNENGRDKHGVLGSSWFHCLQYLDLIKGTGIDYMHGCLLGVTRHLLSLWLNPEHNKESFYIGNLIAVLNRRLLSVQPPSEISRSPRSLTDRKHWKASEYRAFLFYYSSPVLFGLLPLQYYQHFALFAIAVRLLVSESISKTDLEKARLYLDLFCKKHGEYYGDRYMGINIHSLLHLSSTVEELGPLWAYSCFSFEGFNGILMKQIHGTQGIGLQCMRTYSITQAFPSGQMISLPEELAELKFLKEIMGKLCWLPSSNTIRPLGKAIQDKMSHEEEQLLNSVYPDSASDYKLYLRINKAMHVYSTHESSSSKKHCNSCVFYKHSNYTYGQVQRFVEVDINGQPCLLAIIRPFVCVGPFNDFVICSTIFFFAVSETKELIVVKAVELIGKCVAVEVGDVLYISKLVNRIEKD